MSAEPVSLAAGDLIAWAVSRLAPMSDSPRLDAELLLADSAGVGRAALYADPQRAVDAADAERLADAVVRRSRGEPLAYIIGRREFYSLPLTVDRGVLVPRPETELLVERALAALEAPAAGIAATGSSAPRPSIAPKRVLDLGTGSGAIALALKRQCPGIDMLAVDRSPAAIAVARQNAAALGLDIRLLCCDWFAALAGERFDLIVSNPPYVASGDSHFDGPLRFEPREALDGGRDGLDAYRAILAAAAAHLAPGGRLWFEHGFDQQDAVIALATAAGFVCVDTAADLAGLPRVAGFAVADAGDG